MYCIACGQELAETDAFCRGCGTATLRTPPWQVAGLPPVPTRHSGIGIASFAVALVSLALVFLNLFAVRAPGVSFLALSLLGALLAFGLGIAGVSLRTRKRLYASIGIYVAVLVLLIKAFALFVWLAAHAA
jgi:hypothetical protein